MYSISPSLMRAAQLRIRHVGQAQFHAAGPGQHAVELRGGGGTGEHVDLERIACGLRLFHEGGERTAGRPSGTRHR